MLKSRFLWQVWGVLGFTLLISTFVFGFFVADQVERDARSRIEQTLHNQALALSGVTAGFLDDDTVLSPRQLKDQTPGITARISVIAEDGRVLADNSKNPVEMDNHSGRPEVLAAVGTSHGVSERHSETLNQSMLYLAIQLRSDSGKPGYLRLALPLTSIEDQTGVLQNRIITSAIGVGFIFLLIGYLLAYRVTNPISRMTDVASNIAQGEYHLRIDTKRVDEIGQLSVVINELALGAQRRIDDVTRNRNSLAAVLAGLTEGVVAFDSSQRVLHINEAAISMLGLERDQIIGLSFESLHVNRQIKQTVDTCVSEQTNVLSVVTVAERTLECSCAVMEQNVNNVGAGAVLVLEDITERRHLEEVRSDFVANASHELKTPISAIRGFVETIIDDPAMPDDVFSRFMERIRRQTIRLDSIVQDLLRLSRFDSSLRAKVESRVSLADLLQQVYQAKADDASDAQVSLELGFLADELFVEGEPEALNQLVTNLVDNALKYTDEGGQVLLRTLKIGSMAHIEVEDNGIGIPGEETQRVFERFYRIDPARSRELGGTGLGLAIVKHIAQAHNGSVSVESELGQGSVFCVQIPLADE